MKEERPPFLYEYTKNNSTEIAYYILFISFILADLQVRPSDRSGRVTAHLFVLATDNRFSIFFNSAHIDLSSHCLGQRSKRHIPAAMLRHGYHTQKTYRSVGVADLEVTAFHHVEVS